MSNSNLISYTQLSPNCDKRTQKICKITPHHMAGNLSVEACCNLFARPDAQASANYVIGSDGRIALCVDECNRAWTSASPWNDQQAITIEVANDEIGGQWHVSDKAFASLVDLCVDICQRNNFRLSFDGTKNGSLTMHKMFAATTCPGPYLESRMGELAELVNARLDGQCDTPADDSAATPTATPTTAKVNAYYRVRTAKHGWLPEVCNLTDYAGYEGSPITDVAIRVDRGSVTYRVHVKGAGWLPVVTGCDINDAQNGYAGNGQVIDAVEIYYHTPDDIRPYQRAIYKANNYDWQHDNETGNGQDGYAGVFGTPITELRLYVE